MMALALLLAAMQASGPPATAAERVPCDQRPVPRGPCTNLQAVFGRAFYPPEAWRLRQHGLVGYRVRVDRYGNVINCRVTRSSGYPILDGRTCRILRERVVYNPARDARGRAIAGTDEGMVRWVHPRPRDPGN